MSLSTSSSKNILVLVLCLLITYTLFLKILQPNVLYGQSQFADNKIRLENFLLGKPTCTTALVGSSLAFRMRLEDLDPEICSLALAGGSSSAGLQILAIDRKEVSKVLVEMNILKLPDEDLMQSMTGLSYYLKKYFPFFQNRFQPMTLVVNALKKMKLSPPNSPTSEQFAFWLKDQQKAYAQVTEGEVKNLKNAVELLKQQVEKIRSQGVQVVFLEIPMDPTLMKSVKHKHIKALFLQAFPDIPIHMDAQGYTTDDGIHLGFESAKQFAKYINGLKETL